ncbi:MAG TPA: hypothetical protein VFJ06_06700 [Halococcus sp.]|nr:hypothetical protein [Halococcus sp.]
MTQQNRRKFVVTCPECETRTETDTANEVVEFYRRHHSLTGHDIEYERASLDAFDGSSSNGDLGAVIEGLGEHYENGVPIGVITAAMGEHGYTVGETIAGIHELRMTGRLWEPRDDHLSAY